jgi:hypothetical protein
LAILNASETQTDHQRAVPWRCVHRFIVRIFIPIYQFVGTSRFGSLGLSAQLEVDSLSTPIWRARSIAPPSASHKFPIV